jgi:hypothetical protein
MARGRHAPTLRRLAGLGLLIGLLADRLADLGGRLGVQMVQQRVHLLEQREPLGVDLLPPAALTDQVQGAARGDAGASSARSVTDMERCGLVRGLVPAAAGPWWGVGSGQGLSGSGPEAGHRLRTC